MDDLKGLINFRSVIIVSAKLDAGSMFDALVPGADTAVTGFVTLLTCLKQLSELKDKLMQSGKVSYAFLYFLVSMKLHMK